MLNRFFSLLIFLLLLILSLQQTTNTNSQATLNKPEAPFQKFNDILLRNL